MPKKFATRIGVYLTPMVAEMLSVLIAEKKKLKDGTNASELVTDYVIADYKKLLETRRQQEKTP